MKTNTSSKSARLSPIFYTLLFCGSAAVLWAVTATLGNYPDTTVQLGANANITPDAPPTNTARITVSASTNFKGLLEGNPTTGVMRVTNSHPAGTFPGRVTGFDLSGVATTRMFTLTVTTPATCNPVTFTAPADFDVGLSPSSVAVGDFNGDGQQDLVAANAGSSTISIRLGDGLGGFSGLTNVSVGSGPVSVAIGDFNGDGQQDLAVANANSNTVSIRLGDGLGGFSGATEVGVGSRPASVAIGDFNGDGQQDLAVANADSNTVSIRRGDGLGGFSGSTELIVGNNPFSVAIGDFNGDDQQDLAVANRLSNTVSIRVGDGLGGFSGATEIGVGSRPASVAIGDFNGDGQQDLAVANSESFTVSIRLGNGLGGFSGAPNVEVDFGAFSVAIGDFNGDSQQDLAVANSGSNTVSIHLRNNLGDFSDSFEDTVGSSPVSVAIGDFNGDGQQDLAVANSGSGSNNVAVLLRQCQPAFSIDSVTRNEGTGGAPTSFVFTVTKTGSTTLNASVDFMTQDGTATLANNDYQSNTGTLNFAPAQSTMQIMVIVYGDAAIEPDETFTVRLSNAVNATISNADGTGTILNDDQPAPPTPTPTPTPCIAIFSENFDGVTAPALPGGWESAATGVEVPWVTSTTNPASAPNDAFAPDVSNKGNTELVTPVIAIPVDGGNLTFQNLFNMQAGFDGMVLEISINGGAFVDVTHPLVEGSFVSGGYTHTIAAGSGNPIANRMAWSGLSGGTTAAPNYITTTVNLPAAPNVQNIRLKWRAATDTSGVAEGAAGVRIDNIVILPASCGTPPPTPPPGGTPVPTATPGVTPAPTTTPGPGGTPTPAPTPAPTPTPGSGVTGVALVEIYDLDQAALSKLANLSTRAFVNTGSNIVIAGFTLGNGGGNDNVIIRGLGPTLGAAGLSPALANPTLELRNSDGTLLFSNNDWQDNAAQAAAIAGAGLAPDHEVEAAIAASLPPGVYTALLAGLNNGVGYGLVEIYDLGDGSVSPTPTPAPGATPRAQAINVSTRMLVGTGDSVAIGGFVITGSVPKHVLLRAIGPSLSRVGIANPLSDPRLELLDQNGNVMAINNNWRDTQEQEIQATGIPPTNDLESAIDATLMPGMRYTTIVRGNDP